MPKLNKGSLWKNQRKEKDTHPDYKGSANIGGNEYWISGWINTRDLDDGSKETFLGLAFNSKEDSGARRADQNQYQMQMPIEEPKQNNDLPF